MSKYFFIWVTVSIFFMAAEIAAETWFFAFFSIAALLVALATLAGLVQPEFQVFTFGALSILCLALPRKKLIATLFHSNRSQVSRDSQLH